jgi:hypothetical protein
MCKSGEPRGKIQMQTIKDQKGAARAVRQMKGPGVVIEGEI